MSAFIIVDLTPSNTEYLAAYSAKAGAIVKAHGGEFLVKGSIESLHGDAAFTTKVVIQFPDRDSALNWYHSDAYQAIIPTRDQGMDSQFHLVG